MDFLEGNAAVPSVGIHLLAGLSDRSSLGPDSADEVPDGIFHICPIYGLVNFKLRYSILISSGVIEGDTALPVMGRLLGYHLNDSVPVLKRFSNAASEEVFSSTLIEKAGAVFLVRRGLFRVQGKGQVGDHNDWEGNLHEETFTLRSSSCNAQGERFDRVAGQKVF